MLTYTITPDDHCRRLESFLQRLLPAAQPAYCRKLIKSGACHLNSTKSSPDALLSAGDMVGLKESSQVAALLRGTLPPIDLLWQDNRLLAINKPAGLAMHPAAEVDENLADLASDWLEKQSNHPARAYPVNRLDRGTSGAVLLATSSGNAGMLGRQVKEEGLDKCYLAIVAGRLDGSGEIDAALDGKPSLSRYRCLSAGENNALLLVEPVSGRTHQIRRHLSLIGHPILGDKRYGAAPLPALPGIALHSFCTVLQHPTAQDRLAICAPLPAPLRNLATERCGLDEVALLRLLSDCART